MKVSFVKRDGKYDQMLIHRGDSVEAVDCPKQRIIPHDMVHYAVESTLQKRGFLGRVRDGENANYTMCPKPESDGVERLVEVFQGDAWSGGTSSPADMLGLYQVTCSARKCSPLPVSSADILAVRQRIAELEQQWQALPVGQTFSVEL
ncbi:MAG: hypothetical protein JSR26_13145 [Proteobacteria bacterium]|nr:hypothetical protein [Pseudomonadota bacterium]